MKEEKILKGFDPSQRAVMTPSLNKAEVSILRCQGCQKLNTDLSIQTFGECWFCGGHRMCGGTPGILEWIALKLWLDVPFFKLLRKFRVWKARRAWKGEM